MIAREGEIEGLVAQKPAVQVEDEYRRHSGDSRGLDRAAGRTLRGPHRSDLGVVHGPKAMPAGLCSTGEQKALLIGLVLAQARAVKGSGGRGADPAAGRGGGPPRPARGGRVCSRLSGPLAPGLDDGHGRRAVRGD